MFFSVLLACKVQNTCKNRQGFGHLYFLFNKYTSP